MEKFGFARATEYKHMEEQKVEVKPPWLKEGNKKYVDFMNEWREMKLHIKRLFPNAVFKKVMKDKAFFYPEKDSEKLHICRRKAGNYEVEEAK